MGQSSGCAMLLSLCGNRIFRYQDHIWPRILFNALTIVTVGVFFSVIHTDFFDRQCLAQSTADFSDFDDYAEDALAAWKVPGMAVAVVRDGEVVFARGYGRRDLDTDGAVNVDTVFPIASITKTFNATGLAILVDEGRLQWNDRVTQFLPDFELLDSNLTYEVRIADLLSHRTRMPDLDLVAMTGSVKRPELLRRMQFLDEAAPFRTGFNYNNLMIVVAGEVLENVSEQSWESFVSERIFNPLKMDSTVADVMKLKCVPNVATTYVPVVGEPRKDASWNLPLSHGWQRYRETIRPAGSICSSAEDMAKYLRFHLSNGVANGKRLLKKDTVMDMQAIHSAAPIKLTGESKLPYAKYLAGWGLGWEIRDYRGRKVVMHRGSSGAVLAMMPEENIGVVVLTNLNLGLQYMVMHDTFDRLLDIPKTWNNHDWIVEVLDKPQEERMARNTELIAKRSTSREYSAERYVGTYFSELFGTLKIEQSGKTLKMNLGPNCKSELDYWSDLRFRAEFVMRYPQDWFLTFERSDTGHINEVTLSFTQSRKEIATFHRNRD